MNLKQIRTKRNLSQEQLAVLSGLNVRTIQRIEKGGAPSFESLKCLASALDVEVSDITNTPEEASLLSSFNICLLLISIASISILIGAKSEISSPETGAFFYISAAVCFIVTSVIMAKKRLGNLFEERT